MQNLHKSTQHHRKKPFTQEKLRVYFPNIYAVMLWLVWSFDGSLELSLQGCKTFKRPLHYTSARFLPSTIRVLPCLTNRVATVMELPNLTYVKFSTFCRLTILSLHVSRTINNYYSWITSAVLCMAQFYIQLVYRAPLFITLKIEIWVSNIRKHDL